MGVTNEDTAIELAQLRRLEIVSTAEATTLLLLVGVAVPLKHLGGWNAGVRVMGPVHGLAFLAYVWTAIQTIAGARWTTRDTVRLFVVAFVPLGGFLNLRFLQRKVAALQAGTVAR